MDVIRFQCPACSAKLTVPPAAAGFRGRCPQCKVEIIGPNPAKGRPARLPAVEPSEKEPAPPESPSESQEPAGKPDQAPQPPPEPDSSAEIPWPEPDQAVKAGERPSEPSKASAPPPSEETKRASSSAKPLVAALVFSALLCAILAYLWISASNERREAELSTPPIPTSEPDEVPAVEDEDLPVESSAPTPEPAPEPTAEPEDPGPTGSAGPEATLESFLDADGWKSRSAYVTAPERLRPEMEKRAKGLGDGPFEVADVSRLYITESSHIFRVSTAAIPDGFPAIVRRDRNGWKVDWKSFVEFHDDRFKRFSSGHGDRKGVFHLLVKPLESGNSNELFARFGLNPPMPGRDQIAYLRKNSPVLARIRLACEKRDDLPEPAFSKLYEEVGTPMVLSLSYNVNSHGRSFLQIENVVATSWDHTRR